MRVIKFLFCIVFTNQNVTELRNLNVLKKYDYYISISYLTYFYYSSIFSNRIETRDDYDSIHGLAARMIWSYFYHYPNSSEPLVFSKFFNGFCSAIPNCTLKEALLIIRNMDKTIRGWPVQSKVILVIDELMKFKGQATTTSEQVTNFLELICEQYQVDKDFYLLVSSIDEVPLNHFRTKSGRFVNFIGLYPLGKAAMVSLLKPLYDSSPNNEFRHLCTLCAALSGGHPRSLLQLRNCLAKLKQNPMNKFNLNELLVVYSSSTRQIQVSNYSGCSGLPVFSAELLALSTAALAVPSDLQLFGSYTSLNEHELSQLVAMGLVVHSACGAASTLGRDRIRPLLNGLAIYNTLLVFYNDIESNFICTSSSLFHRSLYELFKLSEGLSNAEASIRGLAFESFHCLLEVAKVHSRALSWRLVRSLSDQQKPVWYYSMDGQSEAESSPSFQKPADGFIIASIADHYTLDRDSDQWQLYIVVDNQWQLAPSSETFTQTLLKWPLYKSWEQPEPSKEIHDQTSLLSKFWNELRDAVGQLAFTAASAATAPSAGQRFFRCPRDFAGIDAVIVLSAQESQEVWCLLLVMKSSPHHSKDKLNEKMSTISREKYVEKLRAAGATKIILVFVLWHPLDGDQSAHLAPPCRHSDRILHTKQVSKWNPRNLDAVLLLGQPQLELFYQPYVPLATICHDIFKFDEESFDEASGMSSTNT